MSAQAAAREIVMFMDHPQTEAWTVEEKEREVADLIERLVEARGEYFTPPSVGNYVQRAIDRATRKTEGGA